MKHSSYHYSLGCGLRVFGFLAVLRFCSTVEHGRDRVAIDWCFKTHGGDISTNEGMD